MGHRAYGPGWASEDPRTRLALLGISDRDAGGVVAAPCTGPFMGTALGAAATVPAPAAMAIFLGLGCGLALPFLVVACFPTATAGAQSRAMDGDAQAWVCLPSVRNRRVAPLGAGSTEGSEGWLIAAVLLLVLSFSLWLGRFTARALRGGAWVLALAALLCASCRYALAARRRPSPRQGVGRLRAGFTASNTRQNKRCSSTSRLRGA